MGLPLLDNLFNNPELLRPGVKPNNTSVKINWDNPLSRDLDYCTAPLSIDAIDLTGRHGDLYRAYGTANMRNDVGGTELYIPGMAKNFLRGPSLYIADNFSHTICIRVGAGLADADGGSIWGHFSIAFGTESARLGIGALTWSLLYTGTVLRARFADNVPTNYNVDYTVSLSAGDLITVTLTRQGSTGKMYLNGVLVSTNSSISTNALDNPSGATLAYGGYTAAAGTYDEPDYGLIFSSIHRRVLTADEIFSYHNNLYQVLESEDGVFPFESLAAGITAQITGVGAIPGIGSLLGKGGALAVLESTLATASAGDVLAISSMIAEIAGVESTPGVGTLSIQGHARIDLTGVGSSSAVGGLIATGAAAALLSGVGSTPGAGDINVLTATVAALLGVEATPDVGTLAGIGSAKTDLIGVISTPDVGDIGVLTATVAALLGVETTSNIGTLNVLASAVAALLGVETTSNIGTVVPIGSASISITGVGATGNVGNFSISVAGGVTVDLLGAAATANAGNITVTGHALAQLIGVQSNTDAGTFAAVVATTVTLTGVSAESIVGVIDITTGAAVEITGVFANGEIGSLIAAGIEIATPGVRIYSIEYENRTYSVIAEDRTYPIH